MTPNWSNQTIWTGDNLPILRGMNSESVDLIYLDPPFNSKANYAAPIGSKAAGAAFKDTWTLSEVDAEWVNLIEAKHPALYRVLLAAMTSSDKSYLAYMAARLLELRRVLKPTGSIYLHCDPTMSHYLKLVMDAIFGRRNFRNEIIWKRTSAHGDARRKLASIHDIILFYAASKATTTNPVYTKHDPSYVTKFYRHTDTRGRYRHDNIILSASMARPNLTYEYKGYTPRYGWRMVRAKLEALDRENRIEWGKSGRPYLKRYLHEQRGTPITDMILDVKPLSAQAAERIGYPTQKPLALLDRIIKANSNAGDVGLDPFCGCATACIAAQGEHREWVGIDISTKAAELVRQRMSDELGMFYQGAHRTDVPRRTDIGKLPRYNSPQNRTRLYGEQGGNCAGCATHFESRHFDIDHIIARAKGGTDHLENLQLLCGSCNSIKGDRGMEYLKAKLAISA